MVQVISRRLEAYQEAIVISEDLVKRDPKSAPWLNFLASKYAQFGHALEDRGDIPAARAEYEKSARSARSLPH